jgi:hypothetical protein
MDRASKRGVAVQLLFGASEWAQSANQQKVIDLIVKASLFVNGLTGQAVGRALRYRAAYVADLVHRPSQPGQPAGRLVHEDVQVEARTAPVENRLENKKGYPPKRVTF